MRVIFDHKHALVCPHTLTQGDDMDHIKALYLKMGEREAARSVRVAILLK